MLSFPEKPNKPRSLCNYRIKNVALTEGLSLKASASRTCVSSGQLSVGRPVRTGHRQRA
jgi:hypothetical protein